MPKTSPYATRHIDFADAIRSIAIESMKGDDVDARSQHLANYMRMPRGDVDFQVNEMIDVLSN